MYFSTLVLQHSCSCEGRPRDKPKGVLSFMVVVVLFVVDVVLFVVVVDVVVVLFVVVVTILSMEFNLARTLLHLDFVNLIVSFPRPIPRASNVMET